MKWKRINPWLATSDCGYSIAKYLDGSEEVFRASFKGRFISPATTKELVVEACKQHKEASDG